MKKTKIFLCFVLAFILIFALSGHIQSGTQVLVSYPEVIEGADSTEFDLYFTLVDNGGQVLTDATISGGTFFLGDGSSYEATVSQPGAQAYIVLVLDASGSMSSAMAQLQQAAIQAIQNAPNETYFAVVKFDNRITLQQDFTQDRNQLTSQIQRIYSGGGTCLYDAAYRGLEILRDAPRGRRAIVLFTDGVDITGAGIPCSQHSLDEVINLAAQPSERIPIHVIGLSSGAPDSINEEELQQIASSTGGLAEIGGLNSLSLLFQRIINTISHQWLARADIYPNAGDNTARLSVRLGDGSQAQYE